MRKILLFTICVLLSQSVYAQSVKHGGKIESKYDGLKYETVLRLKKMKVSCDGMKDRFNKDGCVSIDVKLHLPGVQLNHVRNVTLQVIFENKDWVHIHPLHLRDLTITTKFETLRFGRMELVTNKKSGTWDTKIETLEATIPYEVFKRIIQSETIEIQVGQGAVMLRDKNIAALRDLNNRVLTGPENTSSAGAKRQ
ncbi:MAG TPA: hypothetical protein VHH35_18425 [Pyrinomonadaceae bacterium]|nr:hypothetical protein [Pyrinomonadaceae bacterium]